MWQPKTGTIRKTYNPWALVGFQANQQRSIGYDLSASYHVLHWYMREFPPVFSANENERKACPQLMLLVIARSGSVNLSSLSGHEPELRPLDAEWMLQNVCLSEDLSNFKVIEEDSVVYRSAILSGAPMHSQPCLVCVIIETSHDWPWGHPLGPEDLPS